MQQEKQYTHRDSGEVIMKEARFQFRFLDKFLVDKEGHVVKRYSNRNKPMAIEQDIVDLLGS